MNGLKHGAGMLFFESLDGKHVPVGEVAEGIVYEPVEDDCGVTIHEIATEAEATFTFDLTKAQIDNFLMEVFSIKKTVLDCVREEFTGRIPHLATYARKRKTRKKNMHRAFRMLERAV